MIDLHKTFGRKYLVRAQGKSKAPLEQFVDCGKRCRIFAESDLHLRAEIVTQYGRVARFNLCLISKLDQLGIPIFPDPDFDDRAIAYLTVKEFRQLVDVFGPLPAATLTAARKAAKEQRAA